MKHDFHVRTEPHTVRVIGIGCECGKRFANRDEHRLHQEARQRRQNRPAPSPVATSYHRALARLHGRRLGELLLTSWGAWR